MKKDLWPYRGLSAAVEQALAALEVAERLDGHEEHYRVLLRERDARMMTFLLPVLPTWAFGFVLVWGAQSVGWLPETAPWAYAFGPIVFVAIVMARVRPKAMRDDTRIGRMIEKWREAAEQRGITGPGNRGRGRR
jgi:hypothetical protein